MQESAEPHPLDDFEFGNATKIDTTRTRAHKPLLRISVIIAGVAFALVFVFSLLGNNAPFNSMLQRVSSGISNVCAMVMFAACCGILFAYRLPHIDPSRLRTGALTARGWMSNRMGVLLTINLLPILLVWASVFLISGLVGVYFALVLGLILICLSGLAATMAVVHRGYLRGYAVGMLAAIVLLTNGGLMMVIMYGRGSVVSYSVGVAALLTIAPLVGLLCACYVLIVQKFTGEPM